jgi:hypothetical protein
VPGRPSRLVLDLDATPVHAHTDRKQGAAGLYKHTFGLYPLLAYLPRGDRRGEPLGRASRGRVAVNDPVNVLPSRRPSYLGAGAS